MEMPVFVWDAELWTKRKTVQVRGVQSPDRKKEREMLSFGTEIWVCDLERQGN